MPSSFGMTTPEKEAGNALSCFHCGEPCPDKSISKDDKVFCCTGCRTVWELLSEHDLQRYYTLNAKAGTQPVEQLHRFAHLDDPTVQERLLSFNDGQTAMVTFRLPAIHCVACIWLLENLYRLNPAIQRSQVNFPRKELFVQFTLAGLSLRELVILLTQLGYEPLLRLDDLGKKQALNPNRPVYIKLGVAGFCFSNIMLLSFPGYFGLSELDTGFQTVFGYLNIALSLPVLFYAASDYLRSAWTAIRQRTITIDLPIAMGIVALYLHSLVEILTGTGLGYLDSFTGLIFFLLIGRVFQTKTYDVLSFDRGFSAYFPLQATRLDDDDQETVIALTRLKIGDRILVRNQEVIPADSVLESEHTQIDYSFVTGEAEALTKHRGESIFAGGRQVGTAGIYRVSKDVDQSHLTQLWNNPLFAKPEDDLTSLTNRISKYFTLAVVGIAIGAGLLWLPKDLAMALRVFVSVLIVACPCALALSAPFTLGTLLRLFARQRCFARNAQVLEKMSHIDHLVFDKTGTLTTSGSEVLEDTHLSPTEKGLVRALASQSTHPLSVRLAEHLKEFSGARASSVTELPGHGVEGTVEGQQIRLGSAAWAQTELSDNQTAVYVSINGQSRGRYLIAPQLRTDLGSALLELGKTYNLTLLSGDTERHRDTLTPFFGENANLHFRQTPEDKLQAIASLQQQGQHVLMVGDGLNDAGALKQSDVGIAVSDDLSAFSPACDVILAGSSLMRLPLLLRVARDGRRIIAASFAISLTYNIIGIAFAACGTLSPLVSAILMPLSSITVISFAVLSSLLLGKISGLSRPTAQESLQN